MCEGGDDGLVEDGGYGEGAFGVAFPQGLEAGPESLHEDLEALVGLVAEFLPDGVYVEGAAEVGLGD